MNQTMGEAGTRHSGAEDKKGSERIQETVCLCYEMLMKYYK